jgi:hypothetical protein
MRERGSSKKKKRNRKSTNKREERKFLLQKEQLGRVWKERIWCQGKRR